MSGKRKYGSARARQLRGNGGALVAVAGFLALFTAMMVLGSGGFDLGTHGPGVAATAVVAGLAVTCLRVARWAETKWVSTQTVFAQHQAAVSARAERARWEAARAATPTATIYTPPTPRPTVVAEPAVDPRAPHPVRPVSPRLSPVIEGELVER